ncbi:MAG: hypothetical protein RLY31_473 [Bacteroidota bacterium]
MVRYLPEPGALYFGMQSGYLVRLDSVFQIADTIRLESAPSAARYREGALEVLTMGRMNPGDVYAGGLWRIGERDGGGIRSVRPLVGSLNRPVHMAEVAGLESEETDLVISEFGHHLGEVTRLDGLTGGRNTVMRSAGVRMVLPVDAGGDGKEDDLLVLVTQGNERVSLLRNDGAGGFEEQVLLRFPPVHGSSHMEWTDMNGDGLRDLVLANGDNADYSGILKPYHGIRIYLNEGDWRFREGWFHPMNGATATVTRDFDGDGDQDIAAISYFPDSRNRPWEGFIYFEQVGPLAFRASGVPEAGSGRWMVMEGGDIDGDGDEDLVLGSCLTAMRGMADPRMSERMQERVSLLLLFNGHVQAGSGRDIRGAVNNN